jgi:hypothetical protein
MSLTQIDPILNDLVPDLLLAQGIVIITIVIPPIQVAALARVHQNMSLTEINGDDSTMISYLQTGGPQNTTKR